MGRANAVTLACCACFLLLETLAIPSTRVNGCDSIDVKTSSRELVQFTLPDGLIEAKVVDVQHESSIKVLGHEAFDVDVFSGLEVDHNALSRIVVLVARGGHRKPERRISLSAFKDDQGVVRWALRYLAPDSTQELSLDNFTGEITCQVGGSPEFKEPIPDSIAAERQQELHITHPAVVYSRFGL